MSKLSSTQAFDVMPKLYKKSGLSTLYWEAWESDGRIAVNSGVVGQPGEVSWFHADTDLRRIVEKQAARLRAEGYADQDRQAFATLLIQYRIEGMGTEQDLDKRHRIQDLMDECLGWTGLGYCDGGDTGSGSMNVCCLVVDPYAALMPILESLQENDALMGAALALETDDKVVVLWPRELVGTGGY